MKEVVITISEEKYEDFLSKAKIIAQNWSTDGKEISPEDVFDFAVGLGINHHINDNLLAILDESERTRKSAGQNFE